MHVGAGLSWTTVQLISIFEQATWGSGITAADIVIAVSGNDLIVGVKDSVKPNATFAQLTDKITLQNWMDPLNRIEALAIADGSTLDVAGIVSRIGTASTRYPEPRRSLLSTVVTATTS